MKRCNFTYLYIDCNFSDKIFLYHVVICCVFNTIKVLKDLEHEKRYTKFAK